MQQRRMIVAVCFSCVDSNGNVNFVFDVKFHFSVPTFELSRNGLIHFPLCPMGMTDSDLEQFEVQASSRNGLSTKYEATLYTALVQPDKYSDDILTAIISHHRISLMLLIYVLAYQYIIYIRHISYHDYVKVLAVVTRVFRIWFPDDNWTLSNFTFLWRKNEGHEPLLRDNIGLFDPVIVEFYYVIME